MKKILPYIFIFLIFANFLAPFSVGITKENEPTITKSEAEAAYIQISLVKQKRTENSLKFKFHKTSLQTTDNNGLIYLITDQPIRMSSAFEIASEADRREMIKDTYYDGGLAVWGTPTSLFRPIEQQPPTLARGEVRALAGDSKEEDIDVPELTGLRANTAYYISFVAYNGTKSDAFTFLPNQAISTTAKGEVDIKEEVVSESSGGGFLPKCAWAVFNISISGCIAQILYTAGFQPTSYLFGLAGKFFDFTFYYSISDDSYRSSFVIEGWGLVRDFVNIFFIFVLLWIAFATILNVHGFKTKDMVMNVVIIGLLINFSLFATLIIDTSNILARVFYNSITSTQKDPNNPNKEIDKPGVQGETQLSAKIVSTIEPQKLIIKARNVGSIKKASDQSGDSGSNSAGISNGTFILVTVLSTIINIVGIFVFVSVGLIFVARVLGLWLAMIFVPLAFFSYTVPAMQGIDMIGWRKWWPETMKLAFLAPIFIFFMYLIIKFLSVDNFFSFMKGESGPEFIISIIFPFAFIMILMMKAKSLASKFAGDIGSMVTKAAVVGGGVAIAGGAMAGAALGRQTLGSIAKYTQNDGAREKALRFQGTRDAAAKIKGWNAVNPFAYLKVGKEAIQGLGKASAAGIGYGASRIGRKTDSHTGKTTNVFQRREAEVGDKAHAEHVLDETAQAITGNKEAKYKDLTEGQQEAVKDKIDRDIYSKETYNKNYDKLDATQRGIVDSKKGTFDYTTGTFTSDPNGNFSYAATTAKNAAGARGEHVHTAGDMVTATKANVAVGEFITSLRKGSYDIRELSKIKKSGALTGWGIGAMALGGMFLPIGLAIAASTSGAIKKGLKSATGGVDHGSAQRDFLKDLGHTINTALSGMKIDVKVDTGGGDHGHAKADHGDGHGGGGHH